MRSLTKDYMTRDHLLFYVEVNVICKMMTKQKLKIGILQRPFAVIAKIHDRLPFYFSRRTLCHVAASDHLFQKGRLKNKCSKKSGSHINVY